MYIVTDLTPFKGDRVCLAAVHSDTGQCIRPLPYLTREICLNSGIRPGCILDFGKITPIPNRKSPHTEDSYYEKVVKIGVAERDQFKTLLQKTCSDSIESGFGGKIENKFNPESEPAQCSLITYQPKRIFPKLSDSRSIPTDFDRNQA